MRKRSVAVIGAGISGLTAALDHARAGHTVHLFEASSVIGGKIAEATVDGITIPTGPDAFLARRPEVSDLAIELGLEDRLIHPQAGSARIYRAGALHQLPLNVLGVPATADLATSGLISRQGAARAAEDLESPGNAPEGDESVGTMIRRRLGDEVLEYLVDPLLGGINAGDSDRLSVEAGVSQLDALRRRGPSLIRAAHAALSERSPNPEPVFSSIEGGLNRLVDQAVETLTSRSDVHVHTDVLATIAQSTAGLLAEDIAVDEIVVATPAAAASDLVRTISADSGRLLDEIEYSSVGLVLLVFPGETLEVDPAVSGVLVPRLCGYHVTAISFASHKWPTLAGDDRQILRVSVGRRTDTRWQTHDDESLAEVVRSEVSELLSSAVPEGPTHVARWPQGLPQYDVGHAHRIGRIDEALSAVPGLSFVGAWRHGLGLPACVASGRNLPMDSK